MRVAAASSFSGPVCGIQGKPPLSEHPYLARPIHLGRGLQDSASGWRPGSQTCRKCAAGVSEPDRAVLPAGEGHLLKLSAGRAGPSRRNSVDKRGDKGLNQSPPSISGRVLDGAGPLVSEMGIGAQPLRPFRVSEGAAVSIAQVSVAKFRKPW